MGTGGSHNAPQTANTKGGTITRAQLAGITGTPNADNQEPAHPAYLRRVAQDLDSNGASRPGSVTSAVAPDCLRVVPEVSQQEAAMAQFMSAVLFVVAMSGSVAAHVHLEVA